MTEAAGGLTLSPEELRRTEQVDRLLASGDAAIPALAGMLDDPSWTVRRAVVAALSAVGPLAEEVLCRTLVAQRDSETRIAAAVDALSAMTAAPPSRAGSRTAPPRTTAAAAGDRQPLEELANHPDPAVVADVAQILGRRRGASGVATLVRLTSHSDDNVAVAAIEALGRIGGRAAVDALVEAVRSGNFFRTFPAIDVLGRSGDPRAVAPLVELIDQPQYASETARALGRSGDLAAVAPLVRLLGRGAVASVRLGALALIDLRERHLERYGVVDPFDQTIRAQPGQAAVVRHLVRAVPQGEPVEQAAMSLLLGVFGDGSAAPILAQLLDAAPPVGPAAADALRRLGPDADAQIVQGIAKGNSSQKRSLLALVSRPIALAQVVACLADSDADVRVAACGALARMGQTSAVADLFPLLADVNVRVALAAVAAIQSLGSPRTEELALAAAHSPNVAVRRAAMRILAYFGFRSALDVFLAALADPDGKVREAALQGLPFVEDPGAVEALLEAAKSPSERTRAGAMRALGQCAPDLRINAYLLRGLSDEDAWVRYYACQALGRLAFHPAAEAIARLINDPAGQVRVAAVEALSCLKSPIALGALKAATRDQDADIQRAALTGLGVARDQESLPAIIAAAAADDPSTRLVALSALAGLSAPEVSEVLARAAGDTDDNVRTAAIGFLAAIPGAHPTQMLVDLLRDAAQPEKIVTALATDNGERVRSLLDELKKVDDETAPYITSALARLRLPDANAALISAMTSGNVSARKAVASTLAMMSSKEALAALTDAAARDPDHEVRRICALLLAR